MTSIPQTDSLVLYKKRPARVLRTDPRADRLELEIEGGNVARVRFKDVHVLHPGPLQALKDLQPLEGNLDGAWELLSESSPISLADLAELGFDTYTPLSAWAAWLWLDDGLYFRGTPEAISAVPAAEVQREQATRAARLAESQAWDDFIQRARAGQVDANQDARYLRELEELALGRRSDSRLLRELGRHERAENAHAMLLAWEVWPVTRNPYPARIGLPTSAPDLPLPPLPDEPRLDLTHLPAFAIDDFGNQDPDDAISPLELEIEPDGSLRRARIWVHVADAAALVPPGSPADEEVRRRGATLYLPEGAAPMLPPAAVATLGIGLQPVSPALSFAISINATGEIEDVEIHPSWVRAERLTYEQVEERLDHDPHLHALDVVANAFYQRRVQNGAFVLDLPEAMLHVVDGRIEIEPIRRLRSRNVVREAMLLAGEAAARYAQETGLAFPYATQESNNSAGNALSDVQAMSLSQRFAMRRQLKRSQISGQPAPHSGVGLAAYTRVTSPLRRALDLAAHQQLRAALRGQPTLNESAMLERIGAAEAITGAVAQTENLSRRHWTLVYFLQNPEWSGEAILVEKNGGRGFVLIPELGFEAPLPLRADLPLDSVLHVRVKSLNLAELEVALELIA